MLIYIYIELYYISKLWYMSNWNGCVYVCVSGESSCFNMASVSLFLNLLSLFQLVVMMFCLQAAGIYKLNTAVHCKRPN